MKVKFYSPSYKRPIKSSTQTLYPFVKLVVRESDSDSYLRNGNDIVVVPDEAQGNLCRIRNYILDNLYDDSDCIVLLDDDCSGIYHYKNGLSHIMEPIEMIEFCDVYSDLCNDWGFKFWGVNCNTDKKMYREATPFNTLRYIGGPFQAHIKNDIRYDENLPLKEDYDMTLQHIRKYNGCLRINFVSYKVKQAEQIGGCASYRNLDFEKSQFDSLRDKWGSKIVKSDKKSKRKYDFNPIINTGLSGY